MGARRARILNPKVIPETLWDGTQGLLYLPGVLSLAYKRLIEKHHLKQLTFARDLKQPPIGGDNKIDTDKHFAQQFDGSCARAQLALLDPKQHVTRASNAFIRTLSGNSVCITDAPCGCGAAVISLLSTIAELRAKNILPRQPLVIKLIGAEFSETARDYATEFFSELQPYFAEQAITIDAEFINWNINDKMSNTDLITGMTINAASISKSLLIVANFSGYLQHEQNRQKAEPQLEELFRHASGGDTMVIWIEPGTNKAVHIGGLLPSLAKWSRDKWQKFVHVNTEGDDTNPVLTTECHFESPIENRGKHRVSLAVMRLDLERTPKKKAESVLA